MNRAPIEKVNYSKAFDKQFDRAPLAIQKAVRKRVALFAVSRDDRQLHNHPLTGKLKGTRSINITGDWRALYLQKLDGTILFIALGTHSQLYK